MSTSPLEYPVTHEAAEMLCDKKPLDAFTVRNVLLNNLCHYADEAAQVRVAWSAMDSTLSGQQGYLTPRTPTATGTPYAITAWQFPVCIRNAGNSYKLRVRIGGATANASATAAFYAVLSDAAAALSIVTATIAGASDDDDCIYLASTTSTTPAWLTGASRGAGAYATMIEMTPDQVSACLAVRPILSDLSGSSVGVAVCLPTLTIFATTTNVSHVPRLHGVYAAEYIGTT